MKETLILEAYMIKEGYKVSTIDNAKKRLKNLINKYGVCTLEALEELDLVDETKKSYARALKIYFKALGNEFSADVEKKKIEKSNGGIVMKENIEFLNIEYKKYSTEETEKGLMYKMDFERIDEVKGKVKLSIASPDRENIDRFDLSIGDKIDIVVSDRQSRLE